MLTADKQEAVLLYRAKLCEMERRFPEAAAFMGLRPMLAAEAARRTI